MEPSFRGRDGIWRPLPLSPVDNVSHTPSPLELEEDEETEGFRAFVSSFLERNDLPLITLTPLPGPASLPEWGVSPAPLTD